MKRDLRRVRAPHRWRAFAVVSFLGAAVLIAAATGGAAPARTATEALSGTQFTIKKIGTVNVADLPAPSGQGVALPALYPDPAGLATGKAATSGPGAEPQATSRRTKLKPGTQLTPGITASNCGCTPPDMGLGVGGGFKMEQVNLSGRIWDPNNVPGPQFSLSSFYMASNHFISDPWVFFDQMSNRWFAGIVDVTGSSEKLAVSTSATPTTWNIYDVPQGGAGSCGDQAKIGVSDAVVAMSSNIFTNFCNGGFAGVRVTVLNKADLIAGINPVHTAAFGPLGQYFSLVPAQSMNSTTDQWYASTSTTLAHVVKTVGVPPAPVTLTEPFTPAIRTLGNPPRAQQPGTSSQLNTGDNRVQTVAWQSNTLAWTNATGCTPSGDSFRSCARLITVDTSTGTKLLDIDRSQRGAYLFYPAVRPNSTGTFIVGYGRSSTTVFPELDASAVTPAGTWSKQRTLVPGTAANFTGRYGDYFAVAIDPDNTVNGWVAGEIGGGSGGWDTGIREVLVKP
jgi:hypothetical protein